MTQAWNLSQLGNKVNASGQLDVATGAVNALPVANGGTGTATLAANNVILGNGTGIVQVVSPSTSGNVLTSNGTTWVSQASSATKLITDSTDIALASFITPSQSNVGSSFSINIPANGFIRLSTFSGRILNGAVGTTKTVIGIRIGAINYWFGQFNVNGTVSTVDMQGAAISASTYIEYSGFFAAKEQTFVLDVASNNIPTSTQTVQLIMAWITNANTLKGTVKQTRITLEFISA